MPGNLRIIPKLEIKGPNLVKGVHLEGLRVLGKPWDFACRYYEEGADELIYMDVVASLYGRNSLADIVARTANDLFIPLTVGGGLRTLDDIRTLLRAGADKVAINTAAIKNPGFIREAARTFGSQCIVVSIEAKRTPGSGYEAYTDSGREPSGRDAVEWAVEAASLGAGEILLTSVDMDGTGLGYDVELIKRISAAVPVPVIASGGCGNPEHMCEAAKAGADALSAASVFHYRSFRREVDIGEFSAEGNIEFMLGNTGGHGFLRGRISPCGIGEFKERLCAAGMKTRMFPQPVSMAL
ncbi:MAG: imidazole glycerol phosphate synthase subunit HisF [Deltaproteobacteria bacterium]|nr:imidazole glycerol phosphate synthase subunit HisF [Deltaproteobacteria bacterium]MCL4873359.1 imidazole glycerol phosphate synthase cyclase subunit [bacterium]